MILGQHIRLRPIEKDDLSRYVKWFSDPDLRSYLSVYLPMSQAQEEKWFEQQLTLADRNTQGWAIDAQPTDMAVGPWQHIGSCGLHQIDWRNRLGELGIMIGPHDYWGRGYGTDAVQTLCGWAFDTLNLNRVFLRVFDDNARAVRCYEKVGFQPEGRLRQHDFRNGVYRDVLFMGLLHSEWDKLAGR